MFICLFLNLNLSFNLIIQFKQTQKGIDNFWVFYEDYPRNFDLTRIKKKKKNIISRYICNEIRKNYELNSLDTSQKVTRHWLLTNK